jgi:hypothetical protein
LGFYNLSKIIYKSRLFGQSVFINQIIAHNTRKWPYLEKMLLLFTISAFFQLNVLRPINPLLTLSKTTN